ncbi:hypothetical protein [Corynebacterium tapiri]|uniref:YhgE/Pip domain-containing protein n=1 Tax=Corynebacterium tapiri TaxID=1448266 RepID=A0A5C4U4B2_9CORY|nr:hypothetical protein [Corynebacterium tapiri]TNL97365.1 hypothetical protein FHE74_06775 [Corynebacterium tapiri]
MRRQLLFPALCVLILLAAAGVAAFAHLEPSKSWTNEAGGAPSVSAAGQSPEVQQARRAAGEAASQSSLLTSGTTQLQDGARALEGGTAKLAEGTNDAAEGSQKLADGLTQLQAGVGQLGAGATQLADGVDAATAPLIGAGAVSGQLVGKLDRTIAALEGNPDPEVAKVREDLRALRDQANALPTDANATAELERVRSGARELANQLNAPGYAFHDGIYSAHKGAHDLAAGLDDLSTGAADAHAGSTQLREGSERVNTMAQETNDRVGAVNRALPAPAWGAANTVRALPPQVALLVATLAGLIGIAGGYLLLSAAGAQRRLLTLAVASALGAVTGLVCLFVFASGMPAAAAALSGAVLFLTTASSAGLTTLAVRLGGPTLGAVMVLLGALVQLGFVGWVWRAAATSQLPEWSWIAAATSPLNWATAALAALGNAGNSHLTWIALAVLAGLAAVTAVFVARRSPLTVDRKH